MSKEVLDRYDKDRLESMRSVDMIHKMMKIRSFMTPLELMKLTWAVKRGIDPSYKWLRKEMTSETMLKIDSYLEEKTK